MEVITLGGGECSVRMIKVEREILLDPSPLESERSIRHFGFKAHLAVELTKLR